jgi:Ran GTPase-activating protein (RanGAP) involved in mRNA processing and transport
MVIQTEPCGTCIVYNKGLKDSLNLFREGRVEGIGVLQFYVEKMIEYPVEKELQSAMEDVCKKCHNVSVYHKGMLKESKDIADLSDQIFSLLSPEDSSYILQKTMEIHDKIKRILEIL